LGLKGSYERKGEKVAPTLKRCYFAAIGSSTVTTVADRHRYVAYHKKHWWRAS